MGELMSKLSGYRTYGVLILGALIAIAGHFWGPIDLPGEVMDIPVIESKEMWAAIWGALVGIFMRKGVADSGPVQPKQ